jgi:prepilin-type N-terminal cleavage/methylation domain-containing protein
MFKKYKKFKATTKLKTSRGFSLIETLVAISILLLAITGPMVLVQRSIVASRLSRSQITAFYLTQEVMEFIRNIRDNNYLTGESDWLVGLEDCVGTGDKCIIDSTDNTISSCGVSCPVLKKSSEGLYGYGASWEESNFLREINIIQSNENINEIFVDVDVYWDGGSKNFKGRESIFKIN